MKQSFAIFLMSTGAAMAHPGHGAQTEAHWLSEPDHLIALAALAVLVVLPVLGWIAGRKSGGNRNG